MHAPLLRLIRLSGLCLIAAYLLAIPATAATVHFLQVDGVIGPASAEFIEHGLAHSEDLEAIVIALDTPGGLDTSMRRIIKAILASPVAVVTYVSPGGARAASAGTYILYASHIAAMTPASNLGAPSPVAVGGLPGGDEKPAPESGKKETDKADESPTPSLGGDTLARKATNDAIAYLRSLAELRGRNVDFAERAVREAASLSAEAALRAGVIDVIATDMPELLKKIDGKSITLPSGKHILKTAGASIETREPDWRIQLLAVLANPQVAVALMLIGFYALFVEFTSPGFGVPGVSGAICILLALYAFQMLPVNWAGVGLIFLGLALMVAELFLPSFGAIGVGGIVAFVLGSFFLMDRDIPGFSVPLSFIAGSALAAAGLILLTGSLLLKSRQGPIVSGREELIGSSGEVTGIEGDDLWVRVHSENWRAVCAQPIAIGDHIRVTAINDLILTVEPMSTRSTS